MFHVLLATYEAVTNKADFQVYKRVKRWEALIIDEGQRRKSTLLYPTCLRRI